MIKKINILTAIFVFIVGCSQSEPVNFGLLEDRDGTYYLKGESKPFSGPVFSVAGFGSGSTGTILKGKFEGEFKSFFGDGQIRSLDTFKDGLRDGKFEYFFSNGRVSSKGNYVNDKFDGKIEEFTWEGDPLTIHVYENGVPITATNYTYFDNGNLSYIENLKDGITSDEGVLDGVVTSYEEDGNLDFIETYKDGYLDGLVEEYGDNGLIFIREYYKKGRLDGQSTMFYQDGSETISTQGLYENGKRVGIWKSFDSSGNLEEEVTYENGKKISTKEY